MGNGENTLHDLMVAGNAYEGANVHRSQWSPALAVSAQYNSDRCCYLHRGGHHLWDKRFQELVTTGLANTFGEINSEAWKRQENCNPVELWTEAFRCWSHSKGHWQVASKVHKWFGAGLAKSDRGIWYMTIVAAGNPIPAPEPTPLPDETIIVPEYKVW